jgi:aspartate/methionine/tyrosine aminotransferase
MPDGTPAPSDDAAVARMMNGDVAAGTLDLSVGEPDQTLPEALLEVAVASLRSGETGYTPKMGLPELRDAVAARLPAAVDPADVVITVGGTEAVAVALAAACSAGDTVVIPDPAWPNYRVLAGRLGIEVATYRQGADQEDFFDWTAIEAALEAGARMVVVNSPSNPMAATASPADLDRLVALAAAHDALVLSDEAYDEITFDEGRAASPLAAGDGAGRDVVLVARTFSKTYSMTGLRAGALVSPPQLRQQVAALHGTMVGCAPQTAQRVALAALELLPSRGEELAAVYRERFALALEHLGDWMPQRTLAGHGGFYVWLDGSGTGLGADELAALLESRGVRVSSGNAYTTTESHAVRLALTATTEELERAFAVVREVLAARPAARPVDATA